MQTNNYRIPSSLFVLVLIILGAMFYYAAYVDKPTPEETLSEFYEAYFTQDYALAAENVSVFWAAQLLPEYADMKPAELLANRATLEKEVSHFFSLVEQQNPTPPDVSIQVDPGYSRIGEYGALVVYELTQNNEPISMEIAMLIKETDRFYIINIYPLHPDNFKDIQEFDMEALDSDFRQILEL